MQLFIYSLRLKRMPACVLFSALILFPEENSAAPSSIANRSNNNITGIYIENVTVRDGQKKYTFVEKEKQQASLDFLIKEAFTTPGWLFRTPLPDYVYPTKSSQNLPLESGFYTSKCNWASMRNQGVEISIGSRNIFTKTFSWYTQLNFSHNSNKIVKDNIAENSTLPSREGYPAGAIFGFRYGGLDEEGYPLFITKAGQKLNAEDYFRLSLAGSDVATAYTADDRRKSNFYTTTSSSIYELKKGGDANYRCSFSTGEIYLNAAEAALQNSDAGIGEARNYLLNLLAKRCSANLYENKKTEIENMNQETLLQEIYQQRRLELAFEGHRWYDLGRTTQQELRRMYNETEYILGKGDIRYTIPIPAEAIVSNPNLAN